MADRFRRRQGCQSGTLVRGARCRTGRAWRPTRVMEHLSDHRRRLLNWSRGDRHLRRRGHAWCGGRLAGKIGVGQVREKPAKPEGASHASKGGEANDQQGPVAGRLLETPGRRFGTQSSPRGGSVSLVPSSP